MSARDLGSAVVVSQLLLCGPVFLSVNKKRELTRSSKKKKKTTKSEADI